MVIELVQWAYATGEFETVHNMLWAENDPTPCPLGRADDVRRPSKPTREGRRSARNLPATVRFDYD